MNIVLGLFALAVVTVSDVNQTKIDDLNSGRWYAPKSMQDAIQSGSNKFQLTSTNCPTVIWLLPNE
jgi:hypothetical protein